MSAAIATSREQPIDRRIVLVLLCLVATALLWMAGIALVTLLVAAVTPRITPARLELDTSNLRRGLAIENRGPRPLRIVGVVLEDDHGAFRTTGRCGIVPPRETCKVGVRLHRTTGGPYRGRLRIISTPPYRSQLVMLHGRGSPLPSPPAGPIGPSVPGGGVSDRADAGAEAATVDAAIITDAAEQPYEERDAALATDAADTYALPDATLPDALANELPDAAVDPGIDLAPPDAVVDAAPPDAAADAAVPDAAVDAAVPDAAIDAAEPEVD